MLCSLMMSLEEQVRNECLLFQHPRFSISLNETPMFFALLEDAERQLSALKTVVSAPVSVSSLFIHLEIVSCKTGL